MAKTGTVSRANSLELLRAFVEKDPRARSEKISTSVQENTLG